MSDSVQSRGQQLTTLLCPWDSLGKNTGVGCHSLLQCMLSRFSRVRLCATLWTAVHQVPLSLGFSRQEYGSGLPFPSPAYHIKPLHIILTLSWILTNPVLDNYHLICQFLTTISFTSETGSYKLTGLWNYSQNGKFWHKNAEVYGRIEK